MKNYHILLCILLGLTSCFKARLQGTISESEIKSSVLADEFTIYTYLPANYDPSNNYPVVFLLDGDWYFDEFCYELDNLVQESIVEPSILIGIGYPKNGDKKRFRDYTFPEDAEYDKANGKADKFSQFLGSELIPKIKTDYATDTTTYVLMGHSLGGLNALYNMLQKDNPFNAYVAVSASLWWNDSSFFDMEEHYFKMTNRLEAKIYIAVGGEESESMISDNNKLINQLESRNYSGFSLKSESIPGFGHREVPMQGFSNGIRFVLN